jgi:hypothetical protein
MTKDALVETVPGADP